MNEVRKCFLSALKDEKEGKKHKGLLVFKPDPQLGKEYLQKAKANLEVCELFKSKGLDFRMPEEWFYTLYYCALAILSKFGVESRSQKCTAAFLRYVQEKGLIEYDLDFIDRITVHKKKDAISDVDEREKSRYSSKMYIEEVSDQYEPMMDLCRRAISQAGEIVHSQESFKVPKELYE